MDRTVEVINNDAGWRNVNGSEQLKGTWQFNVRWDRKGYLRNRYLGDSDVARLVSSL